MVGPHGGLGTGRGESVGSGQGREGVRRVGERDQSQEWGGESLVREGVRDREGKSREFEEGVGVGGGGQKRGLKAYVPRKWGVRLGPGQSLGSKVKGEGSRVQGGSRRRGASGLGRHRGGARRGTHRTHDTHDALPQQPRVDVIGALAATLGEKDGGEGQGPAVPPAPRPPTPTRGRVPAAAVPSAPPRWE